jgi:hypothetical protein
MCNRCTKATRCGSHRKKRRGEHYAKPFTVKMRKADMRIVFETAREGGFRTASAWARSVILNRCGLV